MRDYIQLIETSIQDWNRFSQKGKLRVEEFVGENKNGTIYKCEIYYDELLLVKEEYICLTDDFEKIKRQVWERMFLTILGFGLSKLAEIQESSLQNHG